MKMEAFVEGFLSSIGLAAGYTVVVANPRWSAMLPAYGYRMGFSEAGGRAGGSRVVLHSAIHSCYTICISVHNCTGGGVGWRSVTWLACSWWKGGLRCLREDGQGQLVCEDLHTACPTPLYSTLGRDLIMHPVALITHLQFLVLSVLPHAALLLLFSMVSSCSYSTHVALVSPELACC
jgi:hypothetical protein